MTSVQLECLYDLSAVDLDIMNEVESILLPKGATPHSIYIDVIKDVVEDEYGGVSFDPVTDERHFVPSSPNIMYYEDATLPYGIISSSSYFDSATLNYNYDYDISVKSADGDAYPISVRTFGPFTAETTPNLYQGYIDQYGNAYRHDEEAFNSYYNEDKLVGSYDLSLDSFNLR
jgi:hypothetical protein